MGLRCTYAEGSKQAIIWLEKMESDFAMVKYVKVDPKFPMRISMYDVGAEALVHVLECVMQRLL